MSKAAILFLYDHDDATVYDETKIGRAVLGAWLDMDRPHDMLVMLGSSRAPELADLNHTGVATMIGLARIQEFEVINAPQVRGVVSLREIEEVTVIAAFTDLDGWAAKTAALHAGGKHPVVCVGERFRPKVRPAANTSARKRAEERAGVVVSDPFLNYYVGSR